MRDYRLVSGDGHVNEPPELWKEGLPSKYADRAPRLEHFDEGDAWIFEGAPAPINFGNNINGGLPPEQCIPWKRWEDVPRAGYDPAARLEMQDTDGVDAEVLYPTPRQSMAVWAMAPKDPDFHLALLHAYNNWLAGYCGHAPERLVGAAMMPTLGIDAALAELERALAEPGLQTPMLAQWPSSGATVSDDDDRFWAAMVEMGQPVSIHISVSPGVTGDNDPNRTGLTARGELRHTATPNNCLELINAGVFDRFPDLNVVFAECDSSWVPYVKEQLDNRFQRISPALRPKIKELPSYYFDRNIFTTYITDYYGVVNRHFIGVSQMMWSSDYPHLGADFPNSWRVIDEHFADVPDDEKHAILAGNCVRVYRIGEGG